MKSRSLNLWEPCSMCRSVMGLLYIYSVITVCIWCIGDHHIIQCTAMFMVERILQHRAFFMDPFNTLQTQCFNPPILQVVFCVLAFDIVPNAVVWFCSISEQTVQMKSLKWKMCLPGKTVLTTCMEIVLYEQLLQTPRCMTLVTMKAPLLRQTVFQISSMFRYFWHT